MSYKTANDLIYGQVQKNKSNMNVDEIKEENPYDYSIETPVNVVKKEISEIIPNYNSVSAGLPGEKRELNSLNFTPDDTLPKLSSPFDSKETRVEKVQAIL